jgi:hypothetical protein
VHGILRATYFTVFTELGGIVIAFANHRFCCFLGESLRKRGKSMKTSASGGIEDAPSQAPLPTPGRAPPPPNLPPQTPQNVPAQAAAYVAGQTSPPVKPTPKSTLKALPTVRDHTTDQLGPGNDEYLPREIDEAGEKKVLPNGQLTGSRTYKCRTFLVPHRGDKLFMLATECARVLGYRDSYLLFNKNRSLFKIIASQVEKDDLVAQEILPFSYRSRQIAIVTARSMFRQFGSRVIVDGRRVRDDYWETKARKQGFTEQDLAGEKRPGASKAREAAAEASQHAAMLGAPHGEIVYSAAPAQYAPGPHPQLVSPGMTGALPGDSARMPMITPALDYNDARNRDYSNILKTAPRQEITGPAYQDRTTTAPLPELHAQAHHAADFNRSVNQQREMRGDYLQSMWRRPHDQPSQPGLAQPAGAADPAAVPTSRAAQSPHNPSTGLQQQQQQQHQQSSGMVPNQSPSLMMTAAPYAQSLHAQQPVGQGPLRGTDSIPPYPFLVVVSSLLSHKLPFYSAPCQLANRDDAY